MAQPMSNEDRFQISCNQLREFIVFRDRLPKQGSQNKVECQLATFVGTQRKAHGHNKLPKDRETVLNNVNPGILAWKLQLMNNNQPSDKWKTVFDGMAGRNTPVELRSYRFATTNRPFIPWSSSVRSYEEFLIRKMQGWRARER